MKKIWKSFIAMLLVIMSMTYTVFAQVDLNVKVNGSEVTVDGSSDHTLQNVMIQTWSGDTKYYIDADKTDANGKFNFKFKTKENLDYNGKVNVGGELKNFQFSTKGSSSEIKVESVKFNENKIYLKEGESKKLEVTVNPENATNKKLIFKSSDEKIVTVNKDGQVTAVKEGKAEIEVTTEDGNKNDKCIINVMKSSKPNPNPNDKEVSVYIRVEGYEKTIVPRTKISVGLFNLNPYLGRATGSSAKPSTGWDVDKFKDGPSNAHAIAKILNDRHIDYDLQDYGWSTYMSMVDGDREFDQGPMSGWMYSVNGKLPPVGCNGTPLRKGDEIVWFYGAYGFENIFTTLKADKTQVKAGEQVSIKLDGFSTTGAGGEGQVGEYGKIQGPVDNATILVNGEEYEVDGKVVKTDSNGKAVIKFDKDGSYSLSAIRFKKDGTKKIDIVRPKPVTIKVGTGGSSSGGGAASGGVNKEEQQKAISELQKKLENVNITEKQLNIEKVGDKQIVTVSENIIASRVREANKIITSIEQKYKDVKLSDDIKVVPIKINDEGSKNTIFKLNGSSISYLKDKEFGVRVSFKDSEIKLFYNKIKDVNLYENIEVRRNDIKEDVKNKVVNSISTESNIVSPVYNVELYKIGDDNKKEEKLDMNGTQIGVNFNGKDFKNISKNSLKINFYDSKEKKFILLKSKFVPERNMVVGEIK